MTVDAAGREARAILAARRRMHALAIFGNDVGVAARALCRSELVGVREVRRGRQIGVAVDASEPRLSVDGRGELLFRDEDRTPIGALGVLVRVAGETVFVRGRLDRLRRNRDRSADGKREGEEDAGGEAPSDRYFFPPG